MTVTRHAARPQAPHAAAPLPTPTQQASHGRPSPPYSSRPGLGMPACLSPRHATCSPLTSLLRRPRQRQRHRVHAADPPPTPAHRANYRRIFNRLPQTHAQSHQNHLQTHQTHFQCQPTHNRNAGVGLLPPCCPAGLLSRSLSRRALPLASSSAGVGLLPPCSQPQPKPASIAPVRASSSAGVGLHVAAWRVCCVLRQESPQPKHRGIAQLAIILRRLRAASAGIGDP